MQLLAIGDAQQAPGFRKLQHAGRELDEISKAFPAPARTVKRGAEATPASYAGSKPGRYAMIHFAAHGKAEAVNPLNSAVVLSADPGTENYKLYARDIVREPIQARLVTISACQGAVSRTYRGEGSVGLAWAFLRAGAGQVAAGLWNVNDEATEALMEQFYAALHDGAPPAEALRKAKQALIRDGYAKPYYWAPIEIFAGYVEPRSK